MSISFLASLVYVFIFQLWSSLLMNLEGSLSNKSKPYTNYMQILSAKLNERV